jgi:hypothetical protein
MPDIRTRLGQYCAICHYTHKEEYLVCDYCNEHRTWIYLKDRYYNYGFYKRSYHACGECDDTLFGPFRFVDGGIIDRAYESIIQVIKDRTDGKKEEESNVINYHEVVRIAYTENEHMQKIS